MVIFPAVNKLPPNVMELPPILRTVGKSAVPLKSPANCKIPFDNVVASVALLTLIELSTNDFTDLTLGYLISEFASEIMSNDLFTKSSFKFKEASVFDLMA